MTLAKVAFAATIALALSAQTIQVDDVRVIGQADVLSRLTPGSFNGRVWRMLSWREKIMLIVGFAAGAEEANRAHAIKYIPIQMANQEILEALDQYYAIATNRPVAIGRAISIVAERASTAGAN